MVLVGAGVLSYEAFIASVFGIWYLNDSARALEFIGVFATICALPLIVIAAYILSYTLPVLRPILGREWIAGLAKAPVLSSIWCLGIVISIGSVLLGFLWIWIKH